MAMTEKSPTSRRFMQWVTLLLALALVAAACGSDDASSSADADQTTSAETGSDDGGSDEMAADEMATDEMAADEAVCPSNLVIQTDWWPEIEHAGSYQLIGPNGTSDAETFRYSGPVQPQYAVGGIETVEVRSGGDAVSFTPVTSLMYEDSDITLGYVNASDAIKDTGSNAVVGVAKTLELNPQMVMWDPEQFDISAPGDLGATGARILHFDGTTYTDFLVGEGFIDESQLDPSYGGAPDQFIESNGGIIQQGFASNELFKYENDIAWKDGAAAPVDYFLIHDLGFEDYPAMYTVRADKVDEMSPCLEVLVPVLAQAWVDALADPNTIGDALVGINDTFDTYWKVSPGINAVAMELFNGGIGVNSADGTYCSFDIDRVAGLIDIVQPVLEDRGIDMASDLSADTLVTNRFCDGAPGR